MCCAEENCGTGSQAIFFDVGIGLMYDGQEDQEGDVHLHRELAEKGVCIKGG